MSPKLMIAAVSLLAVSCSSSSDAPNPAEAGPSAQQITVDTFNLYLAGSFSPYENERRQPIIDAIASTETDILCIQEAWRDSDKDLIIAGVKAKLPYSVMFKDNLDTKVDDPTDQNGVTPPTPDTPPCAATEQSTKLDAVMACIAKNCSSIPGSDEGTAVSTMCAVQLCQTEAVALLLGTAEDKKCYGCAAPLLPTDTIKQIGTKCKTDPKAGLAFDGMSGLILLSKFPLENPEQHVLPGTWNRRAVVRATARIPNGASIDVYCNHTSPIFTQIAFPYTGDYGNGQTDYRGWENELMLQMQKIVAYVDAKTPSGRAIILGDFNSGPEIKESGIEKEGVPEYLLLSNKYPEAVPADYKSKCTYCGKEDNYLAAGGPNSWIDHIFLKNIATSEVKSAQRRFTGATVAVTPAPAPDGGDGDAGPSTVPLSDHYGMSAVINIQP
ncbi:MAG: endonuclease/exonuclease/phosphatase family protein [Deltaproteobacteria bacterium]|nr:endonuclease/exonuclease/phosphatase family protein [Deltaproteobacteria bacterium]